MPVWQRLLITLAIMLLASYLVGLLWHWLFNSDIPSYLSGAVGKREIGHVLVGFRNVGIVEPPGAHRRPQIVCGALGLRREAVEHDVGRGPKRKIAARLACAERDARIDRRLELEELPAVDLA